METEPDSCNVCGSKDSKLIDGFYYCIECGTQNTDVRETILEEKTLGDGTFAQSSRRKIVYLKKDGIEMSGEWYKWHAFNFIILGLADELVSLGARPTFKIKLLWIWIRYIKKYQNKSELMMNKTTHNDNNETGLQSFMVEEDSIPEAEELEKEIKPKTNKCDIINGSRRDIKFLSKGLIIAMLYVALNLDESEIQMCHLYRFLKDKELDISNLSRFVPKEINERKIPEWINFVRSKLCTQHQLRALAMSLLRRLNLGTPKVPDLKKIVDNFLTELCLPNDLKPLIYSLMHFRKCSFLDIDNTAKHCLIRTPDYEGTVMTYLLVAIKICFGLDDHYERKLSDIVLKINEERDLQKSFKIGKYAEPSDRLFSFREWCSYIQFRKVMLSKYHLRIAEQNCLDIDDYVYLEQMEARPQNIEELSDKISMEIIRRLPQDQYVGVIPKELFIPTLTPMADYTEVIIEHCQDPEVKLKLAEDFKQYSSKYACEHLELLDTNMDNIVKGISRDNIIIDSDDILGTIVRKKAKKNMVYVKNCENRNWLKTNRPTMNHVTYVESENKGNDKESDHGYDSGNTTKDLDSLSDKSQTEQSVADDTIKDGDDAKITNEEKIIKEENLEINIFDDNFEDLDFKDECERNNILNHEDDENQEVNEIQNNDIPDEDFDRRSDISDEPLLPTFNPDTFDREKTIKELILFACSKYKVPIPSEYKVKEPRKRKEKLLDSETTAGKRSRKSIHEGKATKELLKDYYNYIEADFVTKVQREMRVSILNAELQSRNLDANNAVHESNLHVSVVERNSTTEIRPETSTIQSDLNSAIDAMDELSVDLNNTDNTAINEKTEAIDENIENSLFEEDEKMNLDDLIPKGDPEFDEKKYDADQLYIEVKKEEEEDVLLDIKADPDLDVILLKKIEECEHSTKFAELKAKPRKQDVQKKEESDSEDDIPLSVFKEEAKLAEEMFRQEDNYERLIQKENISEYKYWTRRYDSDFMLRSTDYHTKFDEELKANIPSSCLFVIQECASILNCTNFYLYKNMQILEEYLISNAKSPITRLRDTSNELTEVPE